MCYYSTLHELPPPSRQVDFAGRFFSRGTVSRSLRKLWTGQIAVSLRVAVEGFARRKARGQDALPRSSFREFKGWRVRGMHGGPRRCRTLRKDPRAAARTTSPVPFIPSSAAEAVLTQVARTSQSDNFRDWSVVRPNLGREFPFAFARPSFRRLLRSCSFSPFFFGASIPVRQGFWDPKRRSRGFLIATQMKKMALGLRGGGFVHCAGERKQEGSGRVSAEVGWVRAWVSDYSRLGAPHSLAHCLHSD